MTLRYFFSGNAPTAVMERHVQLMPWRLFSAVYFSLAKKWSKYATEVTQEYMFDSGAYTSWQAGKPIKLDDLCRLYDEMLRLLSPKAKKCWLINLDVIPGKRGQSKVSAEEIARALEESDANYEILTRRYGPIVLPVYHQDESDNRLDLIASQNPHYICISPRNDLAEASRIPFALAAHKKLKFLGAKCETHGLGTTGMKMIGKVPWNSVDSATWLFIATHGQTLLYKDKIMHKVAMSERDIEKDSGLDRNHWRFAPSHIKDALSECAAANGYTVEEIRDNWAPRSTMNIVAILAMLKDLDREVRHEQSDIFYDAPDAGDGVVEVDEILPSKDEVAPSAAKQLALF